MTHSRNHSLHCPSSYWWDCPVSGLVLEGDGPRVGHIRALHGRDGEHRGRRSIHTDNEQHRSCWLSDHLQLHCLEQLRLGHRNHPPQGTRWDPRFARFLLFSSTLYKHGHLFSLAFFLCTAWALAKKKIRNSQIYHGDSLKNYGLMMKCFWLRFGFFFVKHIHLFQDY